VRCHGSAVSPAVELGRQNLAEPQNEGTIADGARKTNSIRRVCGDEYGMARRTDDVPARRIVLRKYATDRQHHDIRTLPLRVAARKGHRMRLEQADLYRLAFEQRPAGDFHGSIAALMRRAQVLVAPKHPRGQNAPSHRSSICCEFNEGSGPTPNWRCRDGGCRFSEAPLRGLNAPDNSTVAGVIETKPAEEADGRGRPAGTQEGSRCSIGPPSTAAAASPRRRTAPCCGG